MLERVSCIIGKKPVILVCPYSLNKTNSDIITEHVAKSINCFAVINRGFHKSKILDIDNNFADCNNVDHIKQPVIYEEYLLPIIKYTDKAQKIISKINHKKWYDLFKSPIYIFHIHSCEDNTDENIQEDIGAVLGYGLGRTVNSLSCELWQKNLFVSLWRKNSSNGDIFEGINVGRNSNEMNQYFIKHNKKDFVNSMQIEFPLSKTNNSLNSITTANTLAAVINEFLSYDDYDIKPKTKFI